VEPKQGRHGNYRLRFEEDGRVRIRYSALNA
jgi:hypothetical protein